MNISVRQAAPDDVDTVAGILGEAVRWLEQVGKPLWRADEVAAPRIAADVAAGQFFLAECSGEAAGTIKFQLEDPEHWPDLPEPQAAYIHRLAVCRRYAGQGVSTAVLHWAVERTGLLSRQYLRLDCDAARPRLRAIYERFGFQHHSDKQFGPYFVSRYEYDVTRSAAACRR